MLELFICRDFEIEWASLDKMMDIQSKTTRAYWWLACYLVKKKEVVEAGIPKET